MKELSLKQKCVSTIVIVNDGRLDSLTLGQLYKIVNYLLTKDIFDAVNFAKRLVGSTIRADDVGYIADIIADIVEMETE